MLKETEIEKTIVFFMIFLSLVAEVESSRTHFEVLGLEGQVLGLEVSSPRKLACPRLEDSTFFELLKFRGALEKFFGDLFFFFGEHLRLCPWFLASSIPVLGLENVCPRKGCPWPRIFFVSLASSLVSSTAPLIGSIPIREARAP